MGSKITEKGAVLKSLKMWEWLSGNPGEPKRAYPGYKGIYCYMCKYDEQFHENEQDGCASCVLSDFKVQSYEIDLCAGGAYRAWLMSDYEAKWALKIVHILRGYAWEKGWLKAKGAKG